MKGYSILFVVIGLLALLWGISYLMPRNYSGRSPEGEYRIQVQYIESAYEGYRADMHSDPPSQNPEFFDVLAGKNSLKKLYVVLPTSKRDAEGRVLDPWGKPFTVAISNGKIEIHSPGHDLYGTDK